MMDIAFDIETIRNGSMIDKLPELEIKLGNLKDPYKIEEKKADARGTDPQNDIESALRQSVRVCRRK